MKSDLKIDNFDYSNINFEDLNHQYISNLKKNIPEIDLKLLFLSLWFSRS